MVGSECLAVVGEAATFATSPSANGSEKGPITVAVSSVRFEVERWPVTTQTPTLAA